MRLRGAGHQGVLIVLFLIQGLGLGRGVAVVSVLCPENAERPNGNQLLDIETTGVAQPRIRLSIGSSADKALAFYPDSIMR